jgi:hypothetical protein
MAKAPLRALLSRTGRCCSFELLGCVGTLADLLAAITGSGSDDDGVLERFICGSKVSRRVPRVNQYAAYSQALFRKKKRGAEYFCAVVKKAMKKYVRTLMICTTGKTFLLVYAHVRICVSMHRVSFDDSYVLASHLAH